jgi:PAS domain S-box-containing protein
MRTLACDGGRGDAWWRYPRLDIEQRDREESVVASEQSLELIIDTVPSLIWSARPDGSADFFNRHYLEFIGLTSDEASGWGWAVAVHPEDLEGLTATWTRILASRSPGEAEARLRGRDGEYRWFLFRASPLRDDAGEIVKWYGVNTDIEDRKRVEVELRRAYDSFGDAQRLSKTGNFTADIVADDHIWSDELYRIFEIDPSTRISVQMVRDLIHPEDLPAFDSDFQRSLGGVDFDQIFRILPPSGHVKHVHAVGHFIERVAGRPLFIGAIQDVTESIAAEDALNRARSELAHVARATTVSVLTASIAHEVNQPLSGIITNASTCLRMLDRDVPDLDGARETARRIIRDGDRAADVIARLRTLFSRREFTLESLDLNEATREVIALSAIELQRQGINVQSQLATDLPTISGDRVQLQQVLMNLVRNASDAMAGIDHHPRRLLIRTWDRGDDQVCLSVRDTGVGIDPESLDRLFGAFMTTKSGGMGIGLFVSRSIIDRHQGHIWAERNEDGPGSTFSFSIPRAAELVPDATPVLRTS